jgi:hypothetical protein
MYIQQGHYAYVSQKPGVHAIEPLVHTLNAQQPNIHASKPLVTTFIVRQPNIHSVEPIGLMFVTVIFFK